jgi:hypothetical protein
LVPHLFMEICEATHYCSLLHWSKV